MQVVDFVGQPLRFQDLNQIATAQQMTAQVYRRAHDQLEVCIVFSLPYFTLTLVNGQILHIIPLVTEGPDNNPLNLGVIVDQYAIALVEVCLGIKAARHLEFLFGERHAQDAVKREDTEVVNHRSVGRRVSMEVAQDVPTLLEELDAIGLKSQVPGFLITIFPIVYGQLDILLHRLDGHLQVIPLYDCRLEKNPVLQRHRLTDDVVHRQGAQHPVLDAFALEHLGITDVILVAVLTVTIDIDAEDVLYRILVTVEG